MSKVRDTLLTLALLALVFSGPAAVAAYLLSSDRDHGHGASAATADGGSASVTEGRIPGRYPSATRVLTGVLYTSGTAQVDWNGVKIPVTDGSYAYLGGEIVSTGPHDMGLLQLDADNSVYVCPASRLSLDRTDDGAYRVELSRGGGRFVFAPGTDFRIGANQGVLSPIGDDAAEPTVVEVAVYERHPGGAVCGFRSSTNVAGYPSDDADGPIALGTAGPGEIIDLARALGAEATTSGAPMVMQPVPMPASVQSWLRNNASYPPEPGPIGYLCRCEELKRYAEADGIPDAAIAPRMSPPGTEPLAALPEDGAPTLIPSTLLPLALSAPSALDGPGPELPGLTETPLTVPPPLVPVRGSGGGFSSTPS